MANRSNEYVLDELLCYLSNPLFQVPVLSFMENNCLIFDTSCEDSAEYRKVHEEYRNLVDALLEAFRTDTGLTHDQIIKAMRDLNAKPELRKVFQELFEQVLAMDDFPCFVHLMINKNLELQKQALMLITMMHGDLPTSLQEGGGDHAPRAPTTSQQDEEEVLRAVLEQSKREYEAMEKQSKKEEEEFKAVLNISQVESQRLHQAQRQEQERLSEVLESSLHVGDTGGSLAPTAKSPAPTAKSPAPAAKSPSPGGGGGGGLASMGPLPVLNVPKEGAAKPSPAKPAAVPAAAASKQKPATSTPAPASKPAPVLAKHDLAPIKGVEGRSSKDAAADWLKAAEDEVKSSDAHSQAVYAAAASMAGMSEEEYKKRVHFLKQQRDKLMEMKRREREKQLLSAASTQPARPASARAARKALQPEGVGDGAAQAEEDKKMAMRKAIASRIKSEVMEERNS
ncbi:uncharacterized protein LOC143296038 [Babylonia areolata]|uniref:uncharacterized protein LOC143296038 n=1 Tax=Babylonia areolata TaxID=304850 RepID=UPI003FD35D9A